MESIRDLYSFKLKYMPRDRRSPVNALANDAIIAHLAGHPITAVTSTSSKEYALYSGFLPLVPVDCMPIVSLPILQFIIVIMQVFILSLVQTGPNFRALSDMPWGEAIIRYVSGGTLFAQVLWAMHEATCRSPGASWSGSSALSTGTAPVTFALVPVKSTIQIHWTCLMLLVCYVLSHRGVVHISGHWVRTMFVTIEEIASNVDGEITWSSHTFSNAELFWNGESSLF